jgi:hypothetical protein
MKNKFRKGDKVQVRQKGSLIWFDARIIDIGKTSDGDYWASYELDNPVGGFGHYWRSGVHYDSLDPELDNIRIIETKKVFRLFFDKNKACHITEEI